MAANKNSGETDRQTSLGVGSVYEFESSVLSGTLEETLLSGKSG